MIHEPPQPRVQPERVPSHGEGPAERAARMKAAHHSPVSVRRMMLAASIASLAVMAYIDFITGYELIFSAAYLVPVALCAWYLGRREVWLMSIAGGVVSWFVDKYSGHTYTHIAIEYWNAFVCFVICLVGGLLLWTLRHLMIEREHANDELRRSLEELARSTEEVRKLQDGLQVVCAWTKQIKVGNTWMTADEFLTTHLHLNLTHGISPEGAVKFMEGLERDP